MYVEFQSLIQKLLLFVQSLLNYETLLKKRRVWKVKRSATLNLKYEITNEITKIKNDNLSLR